MNTLRNRILLDQIMQLARDERERQEQEAADHRDRIVGWVCCVGLAVFILWEISGRYL